MTGERRQGSWNIKIPDWQFAINADSHLQAIGVTATSASSVITMNSASSNATTYTQSTSSGATETTTLSSNPYCYLVKIQGPLTGRATPGHDPGRRSDPV